MKPRIPCLPPQSLLAGVLLALAIGAEAAVPGAPPTSPDAEAIVTGLAEIREQAFDKGSPDWLYRLEEGVGVLLQRAEIAPSRAHARELRTQALMLIQLARLGIDHAAPQPPATAPEVPETPFERIAATTDALIDAYRQVGASAALHESLALQLGMIRQLYERDAVDAANAHLRSLYNEVRVALVDELSGRTVVHALRLETPADAYRHELRRHDALLLILRQYYPGSLAEPAVVDAVAAASRHHVEAHLQAQFGAYGEASAILEHSSGELVRLLRAGGLDIPG